MMFTTKTEYGLRAMAALARNKGKEPLSLTQIARSEHISQPYLERLFSRLKADGLVKSVKGASGGYTLNHRPDKISVFDIVESLEGAVAVFYCVSEDERKVSCMSKNCLT
ncbi:MAG: Rrf2 family transcriptional regulator, partial [Patescibacteria group bacterium]